MTEAKDYNRCLVCRRKLKNPEYRRIGIGPKCQEKYKRKPAQKVEQLELFKL